jgi:hypothetical protein
MEGSSSLVDRRTEELERVRCASKLMTFSPLQLPEGHRLAQIVHDHQLAHARLGTCQNDPQPVRLTLPGQHGRSKTVTHLPELVSRNRVLGLQGTYRNRMGNHVPELPKQLHTSNCTKQLLYFVAVLRLPTPQRP